MAQIVASRKACSVNPLKLSRPLGGVVAYLGLDRCVPLLHGAQGCTAFGLVLLVKHFRETVPFQTTAMSEVSTILGGSENLEQAVLRIRENTSPQIIGICSNGLIETRGEDLRGDLVRIRNNNPELADTALVYAATPDYDGAFAEGWADAVDAVVETLVEPSLTRRSRQINILAGSHLSAADLEEIRYMTESFDLDAIILPDLSGSLDGHLADDFTGNTDGGTTLEDIRRMGKSAATLALGESMAKPAKKLEARCRIPAHIFSTLTGLRPCDDFIATLAEISGKEVPQRIRRWRSQLVDAMLDGHFFFGEKKFAIAAEPDALYAIGTFLAGMGGRISCAIATTSAPVLERVPAGTVVIGDLDDLEAGALDCDLIVANSQARRLAERLHRPLYCVGMPLLDRLGAAYRPTSGYRGTRSLLFDIANMLIADANGRHAPQPTGDTHAETAAC